MLGKLKNVMTSTSNKNEKVIKPNSVAHSLRSSKNNKNHNSFAGYTKTQISTNIKRAGQGTPLKNVEVGEEAQKSLEEAKTTNFIKDCFIVPLPTVSSIKEEIALMYSQGEVANAITKSRTHLNENSGNVEKEYWYMLMDIYQVEGDRQSFEKTAYSYANFFTSSPPSWHVNDNDNKKGILAGKNILILDNKLNLEYTTKFKEFFKAAKLEKFCRINLSQYNFDDSNIGLLKNFYELLIKLRKNHITSVLMGDNNLINFCLKYIEPESDKYLTHEFLTEEPFFWLLYLELLQWKGEKELFEEIALNYVMKFEVSTPGWEDNGVMNYEQNNSIFNNTGLSLENTLNINNTQPLLDSIKIDLDNFNKSEIDFSQIKSIDYNAATTICHFIQELSEQDQYKDKEIIFKSPNQMVTVLLEMTGIYNFAKIIPKKR